MIALFLSAIVTFFVVIDPPGCAPIYASLAVDADARARRNMAFRAVGVAGLILLGFGLVGEQLLNKLGIELDSFRIAGGLMLFVIAVDIIFEKRTQRREERAQRVMDTPDFEDVSIFPMAMPMIAGPGSIASIMLLTARNPEWDAVLVIFGALAAVLLLTLIALLAAGPIMRVMGQQAESVLTRLLGVLLAALAAQFVIDGLRGSFGLAV